MLAGNDQYHERVRSHKHKFTNLYLVKQRCREEFPGVDFPGVNIIESEDHPNILQEFGLPEVDAIADEKTHGPHAAHYWKWHVINHLIGLKVSTSDFIVFSDADCRMLDSAPEYRSWVERGVELLSNHNDIFIVSPSDGGSMHEAMVEDNIRLTRNVSQQMFLCNRQRFLDADFSIPWNWEFLAPGQPMQEYYYMFEGRMWRYIHENKLWRAILPATWRYWHDQW